MSVVRKALTEEEIIQYLETDIDLDLNEDTDIESLCDDNVETTLFDDIFEREMQKIQGEVITKPEDKIVNENIENEEPITEPSTSKSRKTNKKKFTGMEIQNIPQTTTKILRKWSKIKKCECESTGYCFGLRAAYGRC